MKDESSPQNHAGIFRSTSGVLPCLSCQFGVDGTSLVAFDSGVEGCKPGIDHQGSACIEAIRLSGCVGSMKGIEQSGR